ncbi:Long-chain acyl-CoA synthetase (AMP-forming) [Chitinophaga sp. CF118]|nr:Long-chain acyl-CoA synthetase (AMP-forming) [Chitinophaga sp. CF118]
MKSSAGKLIAFHNRKRVEYTFLELHPLVLRGASYLKQKGFNRETILGIICSNDLEWVLADLCCLYCGIKLLPLERNDDSHQYQCDNLKLGGILVGNIHYAPPDRLSIPLIKIGEFFDSEVENFQIDFPAFSYGPRDVLSFKSTSGSTGRPKIIGQSVESVENSICGIQHLFNHSRQDRILVFLPLSLLQQRYWLYSAIYYEHTVIIVPYEYLFTALKKEKPTILMGVPHIYELIYNEFTSIAKKNSELSLLDYLGGQIRYLWTGSAPIAKELVSFYFDSNIPLYQGYGMNETGIIAKNGPHVNRIGSVGKLFHNMELKFDEEQQILVRSKHPVCHQYELSAEEDYSRVFRKDGYVATGDIGYIDEDGYLFINGRIKEMIALSNSKKIIPSGIEAKLMAQPVIKRCVVYGDNKPYLTALIIPESQNILFDTIQQVINNYNESCKQEEYIYRFFLQYEDFTEFNNLLSNQNKIKRRNILEKFKSEFEKLYE